MLPPQDSLVRYENPSLISTTKDKGKGKGKGKGVDANKPQLTQTEDILNSILPPREWTEVNLEKLLF
jgi:dynein light intermediate chain